MSNQKQRVFISLDIEADGPSPATNSCLMLGFVVGLDNCIKPIEGDYSWIVETKEWCLEPQENRVSDPRCMKEFWSKNSDILNYIKQHAQPASTVIAEFISWFAELRTKYIITAWVARPGSYDAMWLNTLYYQYSPVPRPKRWMELPFSFKCISSMLYSAELAGIQLLDIRDNTLLHTHNALDDAKGQGFLYKALMSNLINNRKN
jgi:hypothetical protein